MARVLIIKSVNVRNWPLETTLPLGPLYLAAVLRAGGHRVRVLDLRLSRGLTTRHIDAIRSFAPSVVGFSSLSAEAEEMHSAALRIRSRVLSCEKIVAGGPYATAAPGYVLHDANIDAVLAGEAEKPLLALVEAWESGSDPVKAGIPGLFLREGGQTRSTTPSEKEEDVDSYPFPAWDLLRFRDYARLPRMCGLRPALYAPVISSRACPNRCIYCQKMFGNGFRARSVENILEELRLLVEKHGIRNIDFVDDAFNTNRGRAMRIFEEIASRGWGLRIAFPNGLLAGRLDRAMVEAMKAAGVYFTAVPVESASLRIQAMIRKNLDPDRIAQSIELLRQAGITTFGFFMLGFPTETEEEMEETIRFACRSRLNFAGFNTVTAFQGTALWEMLQKEGQARDAEPASQVYGRFRGNLSTLSDRRFAEIRRKAFFSFYASRPFRHFSYGGLRALNLAWGTQAFMRRALLKR